MERFTLRIPTGQLDRLDHLIENGEFAHRSEAVRAALRDLIARHERRSAGEPQASSLQTDGDSVSSTRGDR